MRAPPPILCSDRQARRRFAEAEAAAQFDAALHHIDNLPPGAGRDLQELEARLGLVRARFMISVELPPDAEQDFSRIATVPKQPYPLLSAASVPMNLAEGYGRGGREFVRFIGIAYGSLLELETAIRLRKLPA